MRGCYNARTDPILRTHPAQTPSCASCAVCCWKTREAVELATLEWVAWFNHQRLLQPIGYIPPAEAEAQYYRQLAKSDSACVT